MLIQSIFDASGNTPGYVFGTLEVEGTLSLQPSAARQAVLTSSQLTIAPGGLLEGLGIVDGPIENDGTVLSNGGNTTLILNGVVTGNGVLEIDAGSSSPKSGTYIRTLDLEAAASGKVRFQNDYGTLILGDPKEFTGTIAPVGVDDQIILKDIALDSITGYSYSGTKKRGVLTLRKAHGKTIKLAFVGDFTKASFTLAAGPQALSSDPPSLLITTTPGLLKPRSMTPARQAGPSRTATMPPLR